MVATQESPCSVLVTGGAGFIGSHVAEVYGEAGWHVVALDDLSSGRLENVPDSVELVKMDVRSDNLDTLFAERDFDVVNHQAAQKNVRASVENPRFDAAVNVDGTLNLLEACVCHDVQRFVFASSGGTVYGEPDELPVSEDHPKLPDSPYGITKLAGEHYLRFYRRVYGLEAVALRYANVYGPRQDPHGEAGVVAIFSELVLADEPLTVFGDGEQTRDYIYVGDVARANLLVTVKELAKPESVDELAFNVGTGRETTVNELAAAIQWAAGREVEIVHEDPRPGELRRSALDTGKLEQAGWRAEVPLEEGLERTLTHLRGPGPAAPGGTG